MEELRRHTKRQMLFFLLVCAGHCVLGWLLLSSNRVVTLTMQEGSFELLALPPAPVALPSPLTAQQQSAAPRIVDRTKRSPKPNQGSPAESIVENGEIAPPVDWNAELVRAARAAAGSNTRAPGKDFGFPTRPPTMNDYPQFDWDYARTHRVESLPEGGLVINLNDHCVIVLTPFPFPLCSPFKRKPNGELFRHMHDPDKSGDAGVP